MLTILLNPDRQTARSSGKPSVTNQEEEGHRGQQVGNLTTNSLIEDQPTSTKKIDWKKVRYWLKITTALFFWINFALATLYNG